MADRTFQNVATAIPFVAAAGTTTVAQAMPEAGPAMGVAGIACSAIAFLTVCVRLYYNDRQHERTSRIAEANAEKIALQGQVAERDKRIGEMERDIRKLDERNETVIQRMTAIAEADEARGRTVLVIEDHDTTAVPALKLLRMKGHRVRRASTVAEGIREFDAEPPDCLVLDLRLPDGDGEMVLTHAIDSGLPCRLVVMTGELNDSRLARVRAIGATILTKPVDANLLLESVRSGTTAIDLPTVKDPHP